MIDVVNSDPNVNMPVVMNDGRRHGYVVLNRPSGARDINIALFQRASNFYVFSWIPYALE